MAGWTQTSRGRMCVHLALRDSKLLRRHDSHRPRHPRNDQAARPARLTPACHPRLVGPACKYDKVRIREFDSFLANLLTSADHPEIVDVRQCTDNPDGHTRLRVNFASGAEAYVMVRQVTGRGIPSHAPFELPREAF